MIALFGWEAMTAAERFAAVGGAAGLISVVVSAAIAWDSRRSMRKQVDIAAEANEVTKRSVDDQLSASQRARSASVRIAEVGTSDRETATTNGDLPSIHWCDPNMDFSVMTLTLINEGMGPAYRIKLTPLEVGGRKVSVHYNAWWRLVDEGQSPWDALVPFASSPDGTILSIPPGHTAEFSVAVNKEAIGMSAKGPVLHAKYQLGYEDGLGVHTRSYSFSGGIGVGRRAKGWVDAAEAGESQQEEQMRQSGPRP